MANENILRIDANPRNITELLKEKKYQIDYYQREYRWQKNHVQELLSDLTDRFLRSYDENHDRQNDGPSYSHYFLGSIILSNKNGKLFIVDGQQRLTTITLILIYLKKLLKELNIEESINLDTYIFSEVRGNQSFNLQISDRKEAMEFLLSDTSLNFNGSNESVKNIIERFQEIQDLFPEEISGEHALLMFIDWLIFNVDIVEIIAYSDEEAYTIFETMNDRGLSLSPTEMLKGYLLSNINNENKKADANNIWKKTTEEFRKISDSETADYIKAWIRSQYANSIRERKRGALPQDFDRIGTEFHRWLKDNQDDLGLNSGEEFYEFIKNDFIFYSKIYKFIRDKSLNLDIPQGFGDLFYIAQHGFTLQYPVILSPITKLDPEDEIFRKIKMVSAYLEILLSRRLWNWHKISYSTMQYAMFLVMKEIRHTDSRQLCEILYDKLISDEESFESNPGYYLHQQNRGSIHRLLARMTSFVEDQSGIENHFLEYISGNGPNKYEVEHIWANHPERHEDEFNHHNDFLEYRNKIGGLLLLPRQFNESLGDKPYLEKYDPYFGQNILARSLNEQCYSNFPGFIRFVNESGLPFKPHLEFKKRDIDERQNLYIQLAEMVWNPNRLKKILELRV